MVKQTFIRLTVSLSLWLTTPLAFSQQPQPMPPQVPYPSEPVPAPPPPSIWVGLGDSLMTGFNSEGIGNFVENSFAVGSHANSVMTRFSATYGRVVQGKVVAYPGAFAIGLPIQTWGVNDPFVDHAVISIGSNDICQSGNGSAVVPALTWTISNLKRKNPNIKTVLLPIPDLAQVYELGKDKPYCQRAWLLGLCPSFLGFWVSDAERAVRSEKIKQVNESIRELSTKFSNVVYADSYLSVPFKSSDISEWDCFHPSLEGLDRLAESVYSDYQRHSFTEE